MSETESKSVYIKGQKVANDEAVRRYYEHQAQILVVTKPTVRKILLLLNTAEYPMTRKKLATEVGVTPVHMGHLLKRLQRMNLVSWLNRSSIPYLYALTEDGYKAAKEQSVGARKAE